MTKMIYPDIFIFFLSILLGYLSVIDWVYMAVSVLDIMIVVFFVLVSWLFLLATHYQFLFENWWIKVAILVIFFLFSYILSKTKKMGVGDIWIFLLISVLFRSREILESLYFSFLAGGIYSVILVLQNKKNLKKQVPFIPFIAIGFMLAILVDIY